MIKLIVGVQDNWGIGYQGQLLLHKIKEDLRIFKEKTANQIVIMGRKTFMDLPKNKLPNRTKIVITKKEQEARKVYDGNDIYFVSSPHQAIGLANKLVLKRHKIYGLLVEEAFMNNFLHLWKSSIYICFKTCIN